MDPEIWFQWRVDYTGNMSKKIRCKMSNEYEADYHFFSQNFFRCADFESCTHKSS